MEIISSIITILLCGVLTFFGIYGIIWVFLSVWREENPVSYLLTIFIILFFISIPTIQIYIEMHYLFDKPKPTDMKELFVEEERMIEYQDTTHFCNSRCSTCFVSRIPVNRKASRNDICTICGNRFRDHNTPFEQWYFGWVRSDSEYIPYYYYDMY